MAIISNCSLSAPWRAVEHMIPVDSGEAERINYKELRELLNTWRGAQSSSQVETRRMIIINFTSFQAGANFHDIA